jgi:hypothetical protein
LNSKYNRMQIIAAKLVSTLLYKFPLLTTIQSNIVEHCAKTGGTT